ncbi:MAG: hypothetical protein MSA47_07070 [Christensenellaceae bacterium]|nr:hypothetical protein [Christensenellaceae bacterium]
MKLYLKLLKTVLLNNFRSLKGRFISDKNGKDAKRKAATVFGAVMMILGVGVMVFILSAVVYVIAGISVFDNMHVKLLSTIISGVQIMVMLFGVTGVLSNTYFSKDNEFLSSLPVRPQTIFSVKLTVIYLNELALCTVFMLPAIISYAAGCVNAGASFPMYFYFMIPVVLITTPVIPLAIVSVLSFPLIRIVAYFKNKSVTTLILNILLFVAFFAVYVLLADRIGRFVDGSVTALPPAMATMINGFDKAVFFNRYFALALTGTRFFVNALIYIATVAGAVGVTVMLSALLYKKSMTAGEEETRKKSKSPERTAKPVSGLKKALFVREAKCLFRNQSFAFNSIMGSIITPVIVIVMNVINTGVPALSGGVSSNFVNAGMTLFYCLMLLCGTNYTAALAFSREGGAFYVLRYLPVKLKDVLKAKTALANAVSFTGIVLMTITGLAVSRGDVVNVLPTAAVLVIYAYAFNVLCIYRDLKKPNISWTSPYEVIKRNIYPLVPMFYAMGLGMVYMFAAQIIVKYEAALNFGAAIAGFWTGVAAIGVVLAAVFKIVLNKKAEELFERIAI